MGSWPVGSVPTNDVDSSGDNPGAARDDIKTCFDRVNSILQAYGDLSGVCDLDASGFVPVSRLSYALKVVNNLSDLGSAATARGNLGGSATGQNVFTAGNQAAARAAILALATTGGTVTGAISYASDPTSANHLARKSYVDSHNSIGGFEIWHDGNTPQFADTGQTLNVGQVITRPHGLATLPTHVWGMIACQIAELGYVASDYLNIGIDQDTNLGIQLSADTTNVHAVIASGGIRVLRKNAPVGAAVTITLGNWKLVMRANL